MFRTRFIVFLLLAVSLVGCGSMPRTPELLVQNAKDGSMYSDKEVFEVKRPISQVTAVLKEKSAECLQRKVETRWIQNGMKRRQVVALTPTVKAHKDYTQLALQSKTIEGATELGGIPPDGWYMMVVNAYPVNKSATRIESYYQHNSYKGAFTAIKPWLTDTNSGCPDLTQ